MYLFSRQGRLSGAKFRESIGWAAAVTNQVAQTTGLPVGLWSQTFSAVGTLVWATFVPDLGALEAANDKLMVDDAYNDLVEHGQEFTIPGSFDDSLSVVISGEPDPERTVEYVTTVRSTIVAGSLAAGMALGVEIAQRAQAITGLPEMFLADATGNYGGVGWIGGFANIAELEAAQMAINTDASFIELIDTKAKGVYTDQAGATSQLVFRRIPT